MVVGLLQLDTWGRPEPFYHYPPTVGQERVNLTKGLWRKVWIGRSLTNYHHRQNTLNSGKSVYSQSNQSRVRRSKSLNFKTSFPSLLPGINFISEFLPPLPLMQLEGEWGLCWVHHALSLPLFPLLSHILTPFFGCICCCSFFPLLNSVGMEALGPVASSGHRGSFQQPPREATPAVSSCHKPNTYVLFSFSSLTALFCLAMFLSFSPFHNICKCTTSVKHSSSFAGVVAQKGWI